MAATIFAGMVCFGAGVAAAAMDDLALKEAHAGGRASVWTGDAAVLAVRDRLDPGRSTAPLSDGRHAVVANAALYNRAELCEILDCDDEETAVILAAYRRWGESCVDWLVGDFAFAIWDIGRQLLFCARDHFGVRPFYYCRGQGLFAFASTPEPLIRGAWFAPHLDDGFMADILVGQVTDCESTPYRSMRRLPPGHRARLDRDGLSVGRYWSLLPRAQPGTNPAGQFRSLFHASVAARLADAPRPGAMLSGGLDSSSIACIARDLLTAEGRTLPTFSLVYDRTPEFSERPFIEAVLAQGGFVPNIFEGHPHPAFLAQEDRPWRELPHVAPNMASTVRIQRVAAEQGVRVLLCGHGGDEVVSHGYGRLSDLARAHRWIKLWQELSASTDKSQRARAPALLRLVRRYGGGSVAGRIAGWAQPFEHVLDRGSRLPIGGIDRKRFLHPALVRRTDLVARLRNGRGDASLSEPEQHLATLTGALQPYAFETLDRAAALAGVEVRYPFWDKRLVEFCVSLPSEQKLNGGWSRLVLRHAMDGILPPSVQWRRDKLDFTPHLLGGMIGPERSGVERVLACDELASYVDRRALADAWERIVADPRRVNGAELQAVWRAVAVGQWLSAVARQKEDAPFVPDIVPAAT